MNFLLGIIFVIVVAEVLKNRGIVANPVYLDSQLGKPQPKHVTSCTDAGGSPIGQVQPITEAAYNQNPSIPYTPATGTSGNSAPLVPLRPDQLDALSYAAKPVYLVDPRSGNIAVYDQNNPVDAANIVKAQALGYRGPYPYTGSV